MSDYEYQDYDYAGEENEVNQEEDMDLKVEMDFDDIKNQIRNGTIDRNKAIDQLETLFKTCEEHNIKNRKT